MRARSRESEVVSPFGRQSPSCPSVYGIGSTSRTTRDTSHAQRAATGTLTKVAAESIMCATGTTSRSQATATKADRTAAGSRHSRVDAPAWISSGPRYDVRHVRNSYGFRRAAIAPACGCRTVSAGQRTTRASSLS